MESPAPAPTADPLLDLAQEIRDTAERREAELPAPRLVVVVTTRDAAERLVWLLWDWHRDVASSWAPPVLRSPSLTSIHTTMLVLIEAAVPAAIARLPPGPIFDDGLIMESETAKATAKLLRPLVKGPRMSPTSDVQWAGQGRARPSAGRDPRAGRPELRATAAAADVGLALPAGDRQARHGQAERSAAASAAGGGASLLTRSQA